MYIDVRDHLRNSVQVTFSLDSTFGDVRNAVNCCLPHGFVVTEFELVPAPFAHYIEDDPEAFKGPSDEWYIVDVFFDEIAAGLRRIEEDPTADQLVVCLRLVSIAPLGLPHRVGVLFPGERDLDAAAVEAVLSQPEGAHALRLLQAASEARGYDLRAAFASGAKTDARAKRDATIVLSLATVEMRMKLRGDSELKSHLPSWAHTPLLPSEIKGVAGFGVAGEAAALVFAGALTLEEAFELGDVRAAKLDALAADCKAASVVGGTRDDVEAALQAVRAQGYADVAVSHDLFDGALVVAGAASAVDAFAAVRLPGATVKATDAGRGAQTALATAAADDYAYELGTRAVGGSLRYPFYCSCGAPAKYDGLPDALPHLGRALHEPVMWKDTMDMMLKDDVTHFVDAGGATNLKAFMMKISPQAALLMT